MNNEYDEDKKYINNYINKKIIYFLLILFGLFLFLNINNFPKNISDKNQIRPYIKYINDC
jgi:hypothetical protein